MGAADGGWSEERLRHALEVAGVAAFDIDVPAGSFVWSPQLLELFGLPADSRPTVESFLDAVHPDDRPSVRRSLLAALAPSGADRHDVVFRVVLPGGVVRWLRESGQTFSEEAEGGARRVTRVTGVMQDVTRRKEDEETIRERDARLHTLFTSIDEGYCRCELLLDDDGRAVDYRFLEVNGLFGTMTGISDAVGRRAYELVPDLEPEWLETYARVGLEGETVRFEQGSDAMGRWFDVFAMPTEPHGQFVLLFKDISDRKRTEAQIRESEERFRNMADNSPVMVWVTEADGRCTYLSRSWFEFTGQQAEEALGFGWLEATHPDDRDVVHRDFVEAAEERQPFRTEYRLRHRDGSYRWAIDSAAPRWGADGEFLGHIGSVIDITDRKEAEEALREREAIERRARLRAELVTELATELEAVAGAAERAERFVRLLVPRVADYAAVAFGGIPDPVTAVAHHDAARTGHLLDSWGRLVARSGRPEGVLDDGATSYLVEQLGSRAHVRVPLDLGGGSRGALLLGVDDPVRGPFGPELTSFVGALAERAGLLVGSARLLEQERHVAWSLQHALLPDRTVQHPNVDLAARYEAASETLEVGGDWYETFVLPDGRIGMAVGDIVGHGLEAAAVMGRLRAALSALAGRSDSPGQLLSDLDRFASGPGGPDFATACCAVLDPRSGELRYASAGHPSVLVVDPDGHASWLDDGKSWPLCVAPIEQRPEAAVVLEPGSLVVLYSDGLVERRDEDLDVGFDRLAATAVRLSDAPVDEVCRLLVDEMADGRAYEDDVVVLAFRFCPVVGAERFREIVPAVPRRMSPLRRSLEVWLEEQDIAGTARWDVVLAVSEACANAVEHAYRAGEPGEVDVDVAHDGDGLAVRVRDHGTWRPPRPGDHDRGRGTAVMRAVSTDFSRTTGPGGTTVTFCVPLGATGKPTPRG